MSTLRVFVDEAAANNLTKSEIADAVQERIDTIGPFDPEPTQYNPTEAFMALRRDIANRANAKSRKWLKESLTAEELAAEQNSEFYSKFYNADINTTDSVAMSKEYYNGTSQKEMLETNRTVFNYEPWLTIQDDRSARPSEIAKGFMAGMAQNAWRVWGGLTAITKKVEEGMFAATMPEYYKEQKNNMQMINRMKFETLMLEGEAARDWWLTLGKDVPDYIQDDFKFQVGEAFGQLPFAALTLVPPVGMASIAGQYYAEGLEESDGDHRVAAGYTAIFAPIGYMVDRLTVRAGSGFSKLRPGTKGKYVLKELKKLGFEIGGAGLGEFLTEYAESVSLQKVTKGTVDYKQALTEATLAFIVSASGAGGAGTVRGIKSVSRIKSLSETGIFTEEEAVDIIDRINEGDTEGATRTGVNAILNKAGQTAGQSIENENAFDTLDIPSEFLPYTLDQIKSLQNSTKEEVTKFLEEVPAFYKQELIEAIDNPSEVTLQKLNKRISKYNEELKNRLDTFDDDLSQTEDTKESTGPILKEDEFDVGDTVIFRGKEVKIKDKLEVVINNKKSIDYVLENGELVQSIDISRPGEVVIEGEVSVEQTPKEFFDSLNLYELMDYISDIQAFDEVISEDLKASLDERLSKMSQKEVSDVIKSIEGRTQQKKRKIAKDKKAFARKEKLEIISDEQAALLDEAQTLFEKALINLQGTFSRKSDDWYRKQALLYRDRIRKKERREPLETLEQTIELVKKDYGPYKARQWREALSTVVSKGDIQGVIKILLDAGVNPEGKFYGNVLNATAAFKKANDYTATAPKPVVTATPVAEPTPVENNRSEIENDFQQPEPEISTLDNLLEQARATMQTFMDDLNLGDYNFSQEEMEKIMQYVAYKQGYDPEIPAISLSELSKEGKLFVSKWFSKSKEIAQKIEALRDTLNIDFARVSKFYFPLRHLDMQNRNVSNIDELIQSAIGATVGRKGVYYNEDGVPVVIQDPIKQLELYLDDVSVLLTVGEAINTKIESIKKNSIAVAVALNKAKNDEELNANDEKMISIVEDLNELQNIADNKNLNIPSSAYSDEFIFSLISQHEGYGGGQELPSLASLVIPDGKVKDFLIKNGQYWANFVDGHFVVQKMDGIGEQKGGLTGDRQIEKTKEGNAYGANSELYSVYFRSVRNYQEFKQQYNQKLSDIVSDYSKDKASYTKIANKLKSLMFGRKSRVVFFAKSPQEIASELKIPIEEATIAYELAQMTKELSGSIRAGRSMTTKMGQTSSEQMIRFNDLESRVERGAATEQEIFEYLSYSPKTNKSGKNLIVRNVVRALFERQAIDDRDFFSYFDNLVNMAGKGKFIFPLTQKVNAWADYLESKGQSQNAEWWRSRVESNLRGEAFAFEDAILDHIANGIKKISQPGLGEELTGSVFDVLRNADVAQIKAGIVSAMGQLQRARINAFLVGNVGWTLTTQPSSLALTIKLVGFSKTFKAISKVIFSKSADSLLTESDVASIKSADASIGGLESVSEFSELKLKKGFREKARTVMATVGQVMETKLTQIAYSSGYEYAKQNLGLNERDARIHGDFIAAATQSMYDRMTRNQALNSQIMRFFRPMQSYVFTAMSNMLDTFGVVGTKRSVQIKAREMARFILAQRLWTIMWSYIFGDRDEKLFLDPTFNKGTFGSNVPLFGKEIDIKLSELFPWQEPKTWMGDSPPEQFAKATNRILKAASNQEEYPNWERETINYMFRYVTPVVGIPGNILLNNFTDMVTAIQNDYQIQDIKGKQYGTYVNPSIFRLVLGTTFGTKSIDESSDLVSTRGELEKARAEFKKRERSYRRK